MKNGKELSYPCQVAYWQRRPECHRQCIIAGCGCSCHDVVVQEGADR